MGIEDEKIEQIIAAHGETVTGLKAEKDDLTAQLAQAKAAADKLPDVQKKLADLEKEDYKGKYESEKTAHDALKQDLADKAERAAKESALKAYYASKNIKTENMEIALKCTDYAKVELDGEKIKNTAGLDELLGSTLKPLIRSEEPPKKQVIDQGAKLGGTAGQQVNTNFDLRDALHEKYDK